MGDLGLGQVRGQVTDAVTGKPIVGASVACDHSSYTSPKLCQGTRITDASGQFSFEDVFFHDTDRLWLEVQMPGYVSQTFEKRSFITAGLEVGIALQPLLPTTPGF
jgi:hypothetical protein